jgi:multidrug efflux pump subunit AcrA (membrane-fusion protein)
VEIIFEALPDYAYPGEIVSVDPTLVDVDGTPAVQSYASVDLNAQPIDLLSGMNAEIEVIAGEAQDAVLVPLQALREMGPDQHAVFVVGADVTGGQLEMRIVEVGLKDYVNAEILSGLEPGEVVTTGVEASPGTDSTPATGGEEQAPPADGLMRMLGG